jgi:hypothetical protein
MHRFAGGSFVLDGLIVRILSSAGRIIVLTACQTKRDQDQYSTQSA